MNLNKRNLINLVFIIVFLVIIFVPDAKALLLQGLMRIGFYAPNTEQPSHTASLSGIKFSDVDGKVIDLGDLKGKIIFINFWATWCPPCRAEMPSLNKLYQQFKQDKDVVFIFADADGNLEKSGKFVAKRKYEMPVFKIVSKLPETLFAGALPTTIIFDKQGRLALHHEGIANYADQKIIDFFKKLKAMD